VFAQYTKQSFEDGSFEYKYQGPHPDIKKTKELQEQGKKINLSLSEMAQFFMKMAEVMIVSACLHVLSSPFLCPFRFHTSYASDNTC
jgi:hypothetical protein